GQFGRQKSEHMRRACVLQGIESLDRVGGVQPFQHQRHLGGRLVPEQPRDRILIHWLLLKPEPNILKQFFPKRSFVQKSLSRPSCGGRKEQMTCPSIETGAPTS